MTELNGNKSKDIELLHLIEKRRKVDLLHFLFLKRIYWVVSAILALISYYFEGLFLRDVSGLFSIGLYLTNFFTWEYVFYYFSSELYVKKESSALSRWTEKLYLRTLREENLNLFQRKTVFGFLKNLVVFPFKLIFEVAKFFFTND
jgi:hypothetical protein